MSLDERFFEFCRQYRGAEDMDAFMKPSEAPAGMKIADFLFQFRTIVCEVKTFTRETEDKLVAYMGKNGIDPSSLPGGQHSVEQLFLQLEAGETKHRKAIDLITTPLTNNLDHAEKQIRDTKKLLDLPNSDGLLVILNDQVLLAGPPLIFQRVIQRLAKTTNDGSPYYKNINHILYVNEKWLTEEGHQRMNLTLPNLFAPEANGVAAFVRHFMEEWAAFNGEPFRLAGEQEEKLLRESQFVINVKE